MANIIKKKEEVMVYEDDAGTGFEGTSSSELSVPFLNILQPNSPQVQDSDPPGAKAGMLFNTVSREIMDGEEGGVVFLPCHKQGPLWVEWVPRGRGGGFVGVHKPDEQAVKDAKPAVHPDTGLPTRKLRMGQNELVETFYMYGLILSPDGTEASGFAVISFTSTKIKPYRDWVTSMYTLKGRPPIFANRGRIKTVRQKNDEGMYFTFRIEPLRETWASSLIDPKKEAHLLVKAREFREMVGSGLASAAFETEDSEGSADGAMDDSDLPF